MFKNWKWSNIGTLKNALEGLSAVFFNDQIFVASHART